jgi:lipoate-protein ligase B
MKKTGQQILDSAGRADLFNWGTGEYGYILNLQEYIRSKREKDEIHDTWLAGEHFPVITQGVRGEGNDLIGKPDIRIFDIDRGGQTTLHNPGQLVIYPIVRTRHEMTAQARFPRMLLTGIRDWIKEMTGLELEIHKGHPGLFWNLRKVAAVGISIHRGVTMHGIAINICNDLEPWKYIIPCGEPDTVPATLNNATGLDLQPVDFINNIHAWLEQFWGYEIVEVKQTMPRPGELETDV